MANDIERQNFLNETETEQEKFQRFKTQFENKLFDKFGITIGDCTDEAQLMVEFKTGSTANDFVDWIGEKYDLSSKK